MDFYKKIIRNRDVRFALLGLFKFVPDKSMIKLQYRIKTGRKLNLENPQRYTEKIQWYKLNYRNPLIPQCADKYEVRKYIEGKGLGEILNKLYMVYDDPEDIQLNSLPEKFALKTTNGSGTNIFCKDKSKLDERELKERVKKFFYRSHVSAGREWGYKDIKPKIIVEELLEDIETKDHGINDYKFLCFNGKPEYIVYDIDRYIDHKRNFYDTNWNYLEVSSDCKNFGDTVKKPEKLSEMLEIARRLSEDFPAVRVDLYCIQNKIYFGELTFYPWSGYVKYTPDNFDFELGKKFKIEEHKKNG